MAAAHASGYSFFPQTRASATPQQKVRRESPTNGRTMDWSNRRERFRALLTEKR
jgi:hypothetical protein